MTSFFGLPKTLGEAFGLSLFLLRMAGLFPLQYDPASGRFHTSRRLLLYSLLHLLVYIYVNVTLIRESWMDYSQPLLGHSELTAHGNLILRLLGAIITLFILGPLIVGSNVLAATFNTYLELMDHYLVLGIDIGAIYRRIHLLGPIITLIMAAVMGFSSWHSVFYYEKITHQEPTLKYYVVVVLSDYYKSMCLFFVWMQLLTLYLISNTLNKYLMELVRDHKQHFEREHLGKLAFVKGVCVKVSSMNVRE